jgi:hypothetical protein
MNHYLGLTDIYVELQKTGKLKYFETELRERFTHDHTDYVFAPDALFIWNKGIYLCELQYARLSQKQWAEKWRSYNTFFDYRYYEKASWQKFGKGKMLKPEIIVVSQQNPDIIVNGFYVQQREPLILGEINQLIEIKMKL